MVNKKTINKKLPNRIDEYLKQQEENSKLRSSRELFSADDSDIELKTDININEIHLINVLMVNDDILSEHNIYPVFSMYYKKFLRLKVSQDRQSRSEFVKINSDEKADDLLQKANNLDSITRSRK